MQYGVDSSSKSEYTRTVVFPTFRLLPQRTIAHMTYSVKDGDLPRILINDRLLKGGVVHNAAVVPDLPEKVISIRQKGIMQVESEVGREKIKLRRSFFPSTDKPMAIEKLVFINTSRQPVKIEMEFLERRTGPGPNRTKEGPHQFIISTVNHGEKT